MSHVTHEATIPLDSQATAVPLLSLLGIEVVYGGAVLAVSDVSLTIGEGEIVALLGANGAGKSTVLKAISGLAKADRASVRRGSIAFQGQDLLGLSANEIAERGIVHVLEGRRVFGHLTVEENLQAGAFLRKPRRKELSAALEEIYHWFPRLRDKRKTQAGLTSGGEQQMLAIGRALLTKPKLVLLDEPSMGLAPVIVEEIFQIITRLNRDKGTGFLLSEQNVALSLNAASRGYIIEGGRVVLDGASSDLQRRDDLHHIYLGSGI